MVAKTVLVVEDDPCIRIVAEEMFAAAGIEVESVQRADQALDIVAQRSDQTCQRRINSPQKWHLKIPQFS
jgi:DNA-binding NtrC family response regulator